MSTSIQFYVRVVKNLLRIDFIDLQSDFLNKCIDLAIWIGCTVGVSGYLMASQFNVPKSFGLFMLGGSLASAGLFETYPRTYSIVSDFENEKTILYYSTLPIPPYLVMLKTMLYYTASSLIMIIPILPLGKILLWNTFSLSSIAVGKLSLILLLANMFYATLAIFFASVIPNSRKMERLWIRCIFPLWFLGGFQFSWKALNELSPILGKIALCNPITYAMEGVRTALMGQESAIPFWACVGMLLLFTLASSFVAIKRIQKRLDLMW